MAKAKERFRDDVAQGRLDEVETALAAGADVRCGYQPKGCIGDGWRILHICRNAAVAAALLKAGPCTSQQGLWGGGRPCVFKGSGEPFRRYQTIFHRSDQPRGSVGWVHCAADAVAMRLLCRPFRYTFRHTVSHLLRCAGADVDAMGPNGTPLHEAAWRGQVDLVRLYLAHGAQVNIQTEHGRTALHMAADQCSEAYVQIKRQNPLKPMQRRFPL